MKTPRAISELLLTLARDTRRERISLGDIMQAMQHRALAALILLLALPNVVPAPPGTSALLGLPLMWLTAQLALGCPAWLPQALTQRSLPRERYATAVRRVSPWLDRAESLLRPRLAPLTGRIATHCIGVLCLLLATLLTLPIPFGNMLPAFAICLLALGLLEGDGVCVLWGVFSASLAIALAGGVVYGLARAAWSVIVHLHR